MKATRVLVLLSSAALIAGCVDSDRGGDKTRDRGFIGNDSLQAMVPGIWTDPQGCDHWLIDDGVEGYLSQRLNPDGRPVCSGTAPPEYVVGPFRGTQDISDTI